jgi:hypothetical protein
MPAEGVAAVTTYSVRAKRWAHGWELHVDDIGVTQSRTLAAAERQVRDYVALMLGIPEDSFDVQLIVSVDEDVDRMVADALRLRQAADRLQGEASEAVRSAVAALASSGVSTVRDLGIVLKISPQRVQQLKAPAAKRAAQKEPATRVPSPRATRTSAAKRAQAKTTTTQRMATAAPPKKDRSVKS